MRVSQRSLWEVEVRVGSDLSKRGNKMERSEKVLDGLALEYTKAAKTMDWLEHYPETKPSANSMGSILLLRSMREENDI